MILWKTFNLHFKSKTALIVSTQTQSIFSLFWFTFFFYHLEKWFLMEARKGQPITSKMRYFTPPALQTLISCVKKHIIECKKFFHVWLRNTISTYFSDKFHALAAKYRKSKKTSHSQNNIFFRKRKLCRIANIHKCTFVLPIMSNMDKQISVR